MSILHCELNVYYYNCSSFGCPYSAANMNKEMILQDRVGPTRSDSFDGSSLNVAPSPERM